MKSLILFLFTVVLSFSSLAQETLVQIEQLNDSVFQHVTTTFVNEGHSITEKKTYSVDEFASFIADQNIANGIAIKQRESLNTSSQRDINFLRRYVNDSLLINYDSILSVKLLTVIQGDWVLIERSDTSNVRTNVSIAEHGSNPNVIRMTNEDGPGGWNLKNDCTQTWKIRNYNVNGSNEDVEMNLTVFQNFTGYLGRTSDGKRIILRQ